MQLKITELRNGVLRLEYEDKKEEIFVPNKDLDRSIELTQEFFSLKTLDGVSIREIYIKKGWNWLPTMLLEIYWYIFYPYVQYEELFKKIAKSNLNVKIINKGRFWDAYTIFKGINKLPSNNFLSKSYNFLQYINNRASIFKKNKKNTLFYSVIPNNFRTEYIEKTLDDIGVEYLKTININRKEIIKSILKLEKYYFIFFLNNKNIFKTNYNLDIYKNNKVLSNYIKNAIHHLEVLITKSIFEYEQHLRLLEKSKIKYLIGIDEIHNHLYPILYACKKLNIKTIGIQHGMYAKRLFHFMMGGLGDMQYGWFDYTFVWGEYWKNKLSKNPYLKKESIMVGSNKHKRFNYEEFEHKLTVGDKLNILLPHEHLTDTYAIGRFLKKIIDNGHTVYLKPHSDQDVDIQKEDYFLPEGYGKKIKIVKKIDNEFMYKIDCIIGTQTTFLYELMPFYKPIFILEIKFKLMKDMVDDGLAEWLKFNEIDEITEKVKNYKMKKIKPGYYFNNVDLKDVLSPIFKNQKI